MSQKQEASSRKRIVASLLAASMIVSMLPLSVLTASAQGGVDDVLRADRPTAYNQLAQYVDLTSVAAKSSTAEKKPDNTNNEHPRDLFDGKTTTKFGINKETKDGFDPVEVTWKMTEPVLLQYYTLGSGNDSQSRDPRAWTLYGSDNGTDYTSIDVVDDARLNTQFSNKNNNDYCGYYPDDYQVENPAAYEYYKIVFTAYRGNDSYFQLSELAMSGTVASADSTPIRYELENLIDGGKVVKSND